jgi:hypothetical protein
VRGISATNLKKKFVTELSIAATPVRRIYEDTQNILTKKAKYEQNSEKDTGKRRLV